MSESTKAPRSIPGTRRPDPTQEDRERQAQAAEHVQAAREHLAALVRREVDRRLSAALADPERHDVPFVGRLLADLVPGGTREDWKIALEIRDAATDLSNAISGHMRCMIELGRRS